MYPLLSEYIDAILSSDDNFEQLKGLKPVLDDTGRPVMSSGNFAVVFKMEDENGKLYALKCFLRDQNNREKSYLAIAEELSLLQSSYFVNVQYLPNELYVDTNTSEQTEFPVLLMDWVEGLTLDKYIREHLDSPIDLSLLAYNFSLLYNWLIKVDIAHGDLKPDNIIVKDDRSIVLVDYDGMFVSGMLGEEARELGSPDFRHPNRTIHDFDAHIDDFSLITILLSLKWISKKPSLLNQYGAQDRLLFSQEDYLNPDANPLLIERGENDTDTYVLIDEFRRVLSGKQSRPMYLDNPLDEEVFGRTSFEEIANAQVDLDGVAYSNDGLRLLKAPTSIVSYIVKEGTLCICQNAFEGCRKLKKIILPQSLGRIGYGAFKSCSALEDFILPKSITEIEGELFQDCSSLRQISIPEGVTRIGERAFSRCTELKTVNLPNSLIYIYTQAFEFCEGLTSIHMSDSIDSLSDNLFYGCTSLGSIHIPNKVHSIGSNAFYCCKALSDIYIPDSVSIIDGYAFSGCERLRKIRMPNNLHSLGQHAFMGCDTELQITIDRGDSDFWIINGDLIKVFNQEVESVTIPFGIKTIREDAFKNCKQLKRIIISSSVEVIGDYAFASCEQLSEITIPCSVQLISYGAFFRCSSLSRISLPSSLSVLREGCFEQCSALESVTIPEGVDTIYPRTFAGCRSLTHVQLPSSLVEFAPPFYFAHDHEYKEFEGAFEGCTSLKEITLPHSVKIIPECTFMGCISLETIILSDGIEAICEKAFYGCSSLKQIRLPKSVNYCAENSFDECPCLDVIHIPHGFEEKFESFNLGKPLSIN